MDPTWARRKPGGPSACSTPTMQESSAAFGTPDTTGRSPRKKQDSGSSEAGILLANPVPGCGRALPLVCRVPKVCPGRGGPRAPMVPLPIVDEQFYRIAMDIVGPLPRNRSGNGFILVVCEYATRYPKAFALKSIDVEHVAEALVTLFARVGVPKEILTDQETNFTSKLLAELYLLLHVKGVRTSPYHPQTDGLVERFNRTLKSMLRKTVGEEGKYWDKLLPYVLFAYREVPQQHSSNTWTLHKNRVSGVCALFMCRLYPRSTGMPCAKQ